MTRFEQDNAHHFEHEFDWDGYMDDSFDQWETFPSPHGRILNIEQAAGRLGISKSTLYKWVQSGRFRKGVKRGRPLLFDEDVIMAEIFRDGF